MKSKIDLLCASELANASHIGTIAVEFRKRAFPEPKARLPTAFFIVKRNDFLYSAVIP
ncbi:hypothetical protein [Bacteroides ovatus]|uniref:hypothetical protein n=1 Tax=Bacteroides ovatus TaxID=28116 RepID=UPI0014749499|nr:hypothetical protein [Bacteroides ovatus]